MKKKLIAVILTASLVGAFLTGCGDTKQTTETTKTTEEAEDEVSTSEATSDAETEVDAQAESDSSFTGDGLNEAKTIRIGYVSSFADHIISLEDKLHYIKDEFEKDGVEVEIIGFEKGAPLVEALAAGAVDVSCPFGDTPILTSYANQNPVTIIARGRTDPESLSIVVSDDSDIASVEDLKGKKVAVPVGSGIHDYLLRVLDSAGLTESDIDLVNLAFGDTAPAFESSSIDAAAVMEPNTSVLLEQADVHKLDGLSNDIKIDLSFLVGNNDFIEKNPELTAKFLKAVLQYNDYATENKDETQQACSDFTGQPYDTFSIAQRWIYEAEISDEIFDQLKLSQDFLVAQGVLTDSFDVREMYDNKYLEEAKRLYAGE